MDFLLVLIELLSLVVTAKALRVNIGSKSAISLQQGPVYLERVALINYSFSQQTRLNGLWYSIKIWTDFSSVLSQSTRLTDVDGRADRRKDSFLIARPRLHSMQRGKKSKERITDRGIHKGLTTYVMQRYTYRLLFDEVTSNYILTHFYVPQCIGHDMLSTDLAQRLLQLTCL